MLQTLKFHLHALFDRQHRNDRKQINGGQGVDGSMFLYMKRYMREFGGGGRHRTVPCCDGGGGDTGIYTWGKPQNQNKSILLYKLKTKIKSCKANNRQC